MSADHQQVVNAAQRNLQNPCSPDHMHDDHDRDLQEKRSQYKQDISRFLRQHVSTHPFASEEDVVKFVFQGMFGVGHLVPSLQRMTAYLVDEMNSVEPDDSEPLTEQLSTCWFRLNLRPAKARGISPEAIADLVWASAPMRPISFTRRDVYDFCMALDGFDKTNMRSAAERILSEDFLPSHSDQYRKSYHPAYRVLCVHYAGLFK